MSKKLGAAVVVGIWVFLVIRGVLEIDLLGDALGYHIPFAMRYFSITTYQTSTWLRQLFDGYPPLAHLIQGALIRATGRISAANGLSAFAWMLLCAFLYFAEGRKRLVFFLLAALAVPMLVLHVISGMLDLWIGVLLFCAFYSLDRWEKQRADTHGQVRWLVHLGFFLVVASASKYQAWPVAAVLLTILAVKLVWRGQRRELVVVVVIGVLCAAWPIRNWARFGNPTYPYPTPGISQANAWVDMGDLRENSVPKWAATGARPAVFAISFFEASRFIASDVPFEWNAYQYTPRFSDHPHNHFGGYSLFTVLLLLSSFWLGVRRRLWTPLAMTAFGASVVVISLLSQGHELRYWLFIPLFLCLGFARLVCDVGRARGALVALMVLSASWTLYKVRAFRIDTRDIAGRAPAAAREFWAKAERNTPWTPYHVIKLSHNAALYSGPDLNTYYVRSD